MSVLYEAWTDGSCSPNPGVGGYAATIFHRGVLAAVIQGKESPSTNQRAELMAAISAVEYVAKKQKTADYRLRLRLHTDSVYLKDGIQKWIDNWKNNDWKTASGKPVRNRDLWQRLSAATKELEFPIDWVWTEGHSTDEKNNEVDRLAVLARDLKTEGQRILDDFPPQRDNIQDSLFLTLDQARAVTKQLIDAGVNVVQLRAKIANARLVIQHPPPFETTSELMLALEDHFTKILKFRVGAKPVSITVEPGKPEQIEIEIAPP